MSLKKGVLSGNTDARSFDMVDSMWAGVAPTMDASSFAMVDSMWAGTAPTPPATANPPDDLVSVNVEEWPGEVEGSPFEGCTEMQRCWDLPLMQVSASGFPVDRHAAEDDQEYMRWTAFVWLPPTPPDQFMVRFLNILLYIFHTINADHFHTLLYGRLARRYRINPNSRRGRRLRRVSRAKADIARVLRGIWAQIRAVSLSIVEKREAGVATSNTSCSVAAWLQLAAPTAELPPASPPALLTPLEVPAATLPSLRKFSPAAAPVSPWPVDISTTSLQPTSDAAMAGSLDATAMWLSPPQSFAVTDSCQVGSIVPAGGWDGVARTDVAAQWIVGKAVNLHPSIGYAKDVCIQVTLYAAGGIATSFDQLDRRAPTSQTYLLLKDYQGASSSLALPEAPAHLHILCSSLPAACHNCTTRSEAPVSPWSRSAIPVLIMHGAPGAVVTMTSALDTLNWSFQSQRLAVTDVDQADSMRPKNGWNGTIETGFSRWSAACPMELVDLRWSMTKAVKSRPRTRYAQGVRTQARYCTPGDTSPSSKGHNCHERMSLSYVKETYPVALSVFALAMYVCVVRWQGSYVC